MRANTANEYLNTNILRARAGIEQRPLVYYHIVL